MDKNQIAKLDNNLLVSMFVSNVGADYKTDYSPHIHPDFSDDTKALWSEIEVRIHGRETLDFDRKKFLSRCNEELKKQDDILNAGPDYSTSYHYGIRSGLNIALRIMSECLTASEDEPEVQNG